MHDFHAAWNSLRDSDDSRYIAMAMPRFLSRHPYGAKTDPIDSFDFEEFSPFAGHPQYLWGHAPVLCASLLAEAFCKSGWSLMNSLGSHATEIPMHTYELTQGT